MDVNEQSSESILLGRIVEGEKELYAELVEKYQSMCYTLALRILKDPMEAEEAAQDGFIKAYRSLKYFNRKSKFSSWLYRIVYNTAISYHRKRKKTESFEVVKFDRGHRTEDRGMEYQDRKKFIAEALNKLNPEDASIMTLFYFEEQTLEEIGKIMALKPNLVKVKLHRARKKMARELKGILNEEVESL